MSDEIKNGCDEMTAYVEAGQRDGFSMDIEETCEMFDRAGKHAASLKRAVEGIQSAMDATNEMDMQVILSEALSNISTICAAASRPHDPK